MIEGIFIGNELCDGRTVNTNQQQLASLLYTHGFYLKQSTTIDDDPDTIKQSLHTALTRSHVIITTGGLGPTEDDRTTASIAKACGLDLVCDQASLDELHHRYTSRKRVMAKTNIKQAYFPKGATIIPNRLGTAPGFYLLYKDCHIFSFPGVPTEAIAMWKSSLIPILLTLVPATAPKLVGIFKCAGIGESDCADRIETHLSYPPSLFLTYQAKPGEVHVRLHATSKASSEKIYDIKEKLISLLSDVCFTMNPDKSLAECIISHLTSRRATLSVAESCTGGAISRALIAIPGASDVINCNLTTYSNTAKMQWLNVSPETLAKVGAVSKETVSEMAIGAQKHMNASYALAVSGIAGPNGGTPHTPVGTVWYALASTTGIETNCHHFSGSRALVQERATHMGLFLIYMHLKNLD